MGQKSRLVQQGKTLTPTLSLGEREEYLDSRLRGNDK